MSLRSVIVSCFCLAAVSLVAETPEAQKSSVDAIAAIDQQIQNLKNERAQCQLTEAQASDQADQFLNSNDWMNYRQAVTQQTNMQYRMQEIDEQIAELQQKKQQMLNKK